MTLKSFVAFALVVSCSSAAWSDHAKDDTFEGTWLPEAMIQTAILLAAPAAVLYEDWDKKNNDPSDPFAGISSRPDFAGIIYPGPTPFARNRTVPPIPKDVPPAFLVCGSAGDRVHAIWALEYYQAMLMAGVPNVEIHLYGNGRHPGDPMPDGSRMSGGLTDRNNIPFGTWQFRFIDWARDLGFLQKPGIETKAAKDVAGYICG